MGRHRLSRSLMRLLATKSNDTSLSRSTQNKAGRRLSPTQPEAGWGAVSFSSLHLLLTRSLTFGPGDLLVPPGRRLALSRSNWPGNLYRNFFQEIIETIFLSKKIYDGKNFRGGVTEKR